jgi:hypothetical protein
LGNTVGGGRGVAAGGDSVTAAGEGDLEGDGVTEGGVGTHAATIRQSNPIIATRLRVKGFMASSLEE